MDRRLQTTVDQVVTSRLRLRTATARRMAVLHHHSSSNKDTAVLHLLQLQREYCYLHASRYYTDVVTARTSATMYALLGGPTNVRLKH